MLLRQIMVVGLLVLPLWVQSAGLEPDTGVDPSVKSELEAKVEAAQAVKSPASLIDSPLDSKGVERSTPDVEKSAAERDSAPAAVARPSFLAAGKPSNGSNLGSGVVSADPMTVVLTLSFIIALIFVVAWLVRRLGGVNVAGGQLMKVVAVLSVGNREKVVLVDVGGQQLLIGVAPGRVSQLHAFDQPPIDSTASQGSPLLANVFSQKLKKFMQTENTKGSAS